MDILLSSCLFTGDKTSGWVQTFSMPGGPSSLIPAFTSSMAATMPPTHRQKRILGMHEHQTAELRLNLRWCRCARTGSTSGTRLTASLAGTQ
jgi:hypothetical protein